MTGAVPQVSVVMAVRDGLPYVEQAVASVLAQTCRDLELVAVDDGSTDGTSGLLADAAARDPRVRVVGGPARGFVPALLTGCAAATAPVLARLDADDVAEPDWLERHLALRAAQPGAALVTGGYAEVRADGSTFKTKQPPTGLPPVEAAERLLQANFVTHSGVTMTAAAYTAVGGYRAAFGPATDYDLWLRLTDAHELHVLPGVLVRYRYHGEQMTGARSRAMAVGDVVARRAARLRRAGEPDPVPEAAATPEDLEALLDLPPDEVRAAELSLLLWYAGKQAQAGYRDAAATLLAAADRVARGEADEAAVREARARLLARPSRVRALARRLARAAGAAG